MESYIIMSSIGRPYPNFTWSRDDGHNMPLNSSVKSLSSFSFLAINVTDIQDFGSYKVVMSNDLGSYTAIYTLLAAGKGFFILFFRIDAFAKY